MQQTIRNDRLAVTVKQAGAELCSIRDARGIEYVWQADPAVWARHAPILFPIVGQVKGGTYRWQGQSYAMGQHGFARDCVFECVAQEPAQLAYRLAAHDRTRQQYPFEFELRVSFRLDGLTLHVGYEVDNAGPDTMPFNIGAHPGFACSWHAGDVLEDYYLEFEHPETSSRHFIENGLLARRTEPLLEGRRELPLTRTLFRDGALILLDHRSRLVSLCCRKASNRVTVEFPDFPSLGLWAIPGAPYVCIEPWFGHADPEDHDGDFARKPGIRLLAPGGQFRCEHRIRIRPE